MIYTALLASLLLAQPPADPTRWRCLRFQHPGEASVIVTRGLDSGGRPLTDEVLWLSDRSAAGSSVRWVRRGALASTRLPWILHATSLRTDLNLSRPAQRPVWLVLRIDGRIAGRRLLLRQMSDLSPYDREHLRTTAWFSDDQPGYGPVPDLTNAREIVITAEEEGGQTLATSAIHLPGTDLVAGIVAQLAPLLASDAADYRNRCRDTSRPLPAPPMPQPPS